MTRLCVYVPCQAGGYLELEYVQVLPSTDDVDYHEEKRSRKRRLATQHALTGHRSDQAIEAQEVRHTIGTHIPIIRRLLPPVRFYPTVLLCISSINTNI
jgi:hypothetical protein